MIINQQGVHMSGGTHVMGYTCHGVHVMGYTCHGVHVSRGIRVRGYTCQGVHMSRGTGEIKLIAHLLLPCS